MEKETVELQFKELQQHQMITMDLVTELLQYLSKYQHINILLLKLIVQILKG